MSPAISAFIAACLAQEGLPYVWPTAANDYSGKGKLSSDYPEGRDCSGLVSVALRAAGDIDRRDEWDAQRYWTELQKTQDPQAGDFAIYGSPERANHIMVCWLDGRVFGACGNSDMTRPELARQKRACVKFKDSDRYRPDLLGFVINPLRSAP